MTPTIPELLRGDLPFSDRPLPVQAAVNNLVICRMRGGLRALFIPQLEPVDGEAEGSERHIFLKNLAVFDASGACVRKAGHEPVAPSCAHDMGAGTESPSGDLRWSPPGAGDLLYGQLIPTGGAALAVVELEALAIPAAAFVPTSPGPRFINFGSFIQGLGASDPKSGAWRQEVGGEVYFLAPLYFPQRSSLIAAEIYIADHSEAAGCDVSARVDRIDRRGAIQELLRVRSRGARGRQDLLHAGIIGREVDNNVDAFHIHVTWQFPPTPHQQDLRLYGARVRYMPKRPDFIER